MRRITPLVLAAVLLAGCQDRDLAGPEAGPYSAAISDAAHDVTLTGPQAFFYFLPPMVSDPGPLGEFNPALLPAVQICVGDDTGECDQLALFTAMTGPGSETVRVDEEAGQYLVNWHLDATGTTSGSYQIRVLLSGIVMGWADVEVVEDGKALKNLRTQDVIGLKDGRTLAVKFFIDQQAFCDPDVEHCVTASIPAADGGQVSLPSHDNVFFPPQPGGTFTVYTQDGTGTEEVSSLETTISDCSPEDEFELDLRMFGACFKVTTDRKLVPILDQTFRPTVSACSIEAPDLTGLTLEQIEQITIHQGDLVDGEWQIKALQHQEEYCPEPPPWEVSSSAQGLFQWAKAGWNALRTLIGPEPLSAGPPRRMFFHEARGAKPIEFSSFRPGMPAQMVPVSALNRPGVEGQILTTLVQAVDWYGEGTAGATLRFDVLGGGSIAGDAVRTSDVYGFVEVDWTLGAGPNELHVTGRGLAGLEDDGPFTPFTGPDTPQLPDVPLVLDRELVFLASPYPPSTPPISCTAQPGGDLLWRGFYVPNYAGSAVEQVDLFFSARAAGDYTIRLTVREGTFDGAVIGVAEATVTLTADDHDNRLTSFYFPASAVTPGTLLTFAMELVSGPSDEVFFAVSEDTECPAVETEDTTPPLSTDRFGGRGVGLNIFEVAAGTVLYSVSSVDDGLSIIDVTTGDGTFIGPLDPDPNIYTTPVAMAVGSAGELLVWNNTNGNDPLEPTGVLLTVDRCTGLAAQISPEGQGSLQALAVAPDGSLYGVDSQLFPVDRTTGVRGPAIGSLGFRATGAAFDAGGTLYVVNIDATTLATVDLTTGVATEIASLSQDLGLLGSLVFTPDGRLLAAASDGYSTNLFDIDVTDGTVSNVRPVTSVPLPQGMGFAQACSEE